MEKEQQLYDKFVDVLYGILDDKPSAQHLSVILNFLKYSNSQKEEEKPLEEEVFDTVQIRLPFGGSKRE